MGIENTILVGCEVTSYKISALATTFTPLGPGYPIEATIFANGNYNFEMGKIPAGSTGIRDAYVWAFIGNRSFVSSNITLTIATTCGLKLT